MTETIGITKHV